MIVKEERCHHPVVAMVVIRNACEVEIRGLWLSQLDAIQRTLSQPDSFIVPFFLFVRIDSHRFASTPKLDDIIGQSVFGSQKITRGV